MNADWRNEAATEAQKEKLRFFGCTWDEGITAGQAKEALEECARQFPETEAAYLNRSVPPIQPVEASLPEITIQEAETSLNSKPPRLDDFYPSIPQAALAAATAKTANSQDYTIPASDVQSFAQRPASQGINYQYERNRPAPEELKVKLRFFCCSWDEGITERTAIVEVVPDQKLVMVVLSPGKKIREFGSSEVEIHTRVVREMKTVLLGDEEPAYLDPTSKLLLCSARKVARAASLDKGDIIFGRQKIQWFPWIGTRTLLTLSLLAKSANIVHERDDLSITYHLAQREEFFAHLREIANSKPDAVSLARLMPTKAVEKFDNFAPEDLLDVSNAQRRLNVLEALTSCAAAAKSMV